MNILSSINYKLESFILQQRFEKYFNDKSNSDRKSNFIIEFIGPPGVGKTTYSKVLVKSLELENRVVLANDIRTLLNTSVKEYMKFGDFHLLLLNDFLHYIKMENQLIDFKMSTIRIMLSELECDALSRSFNGIVINDEGISHHFTGLLTKNINSARNINIINNYLKNRLIVFINEPKELVLERIKNRLLHQNHVWNGHKGLSDNEIMDLTEKDLKIKMDFCNLILGIKESAIITINRKKNIYENIKQIKESIFMC